MDDSEIDEDEEGDAEDSDNDDDYNPRSDVSLLRLSVNKYAARIENVTSFGASLAMSHSVGVTCLHVPRC